MGVMLLKKRTMAILSALIFVLGFLGNLYFSKFIDQALKQQFRNVSWPNLMDSIQSLASDSRHLLLFLCLQGVVILMIVLLFFSNNRPYQSSLVAITPEIHTPIPAGQNQFGSASWMKESEKRDAFASYEMDKRAKRTKEIPSGGIVLGKDQKWGKERIYYVESDTHTLCIGATRSGKTRTVVLQTIGTLALGGESMVLSDPKGELYQFTYPYLKERGYKVIAIDFKNPRKSNQYNFLQPVIDAVDEGDIPKAVDAVWDITSQLVGEPKGERIWTDGEASIIASAIMSVVWDNRDGENRIYQNLTNVYFFIAEMCKSINGKMPIMEYVKRLPEDHPAKGLLAISEVAPAKTRGSFYTAALATLRLFTNPSIYGMTNHSEYDPMSLGREKMAIFIILPDEKSTYYSLASLLVSQHYIELVKAADERGGRLQNRVNFVLDEFGNFAAIPDFANKLTVGGGRGIRFNLFVQSFAQLDEKYNKDVARIIMGNCENWIYLQTDDSETRKELSEKLGNYTISTYSISSSHGRYTNPTGSHSINLTHRPLLTPDEIGRINRPYSLVTSRKKPVIMYSPDLSKWQFNQLYGMGNESFNIKLREMRENSRPARKHTDKIELWNVWVYFIATCMVKEDPLSIF